MHLKVMNLFQDSLPLLFCKLYTYVNNNYYTFYLKVPSLAIKDLMQTSTSIFTQCTLKTVKTIETRQLASDGICTYPATFYSCCTSTDAVSYIY